MNEQWLSEYETFEKRHWWFVARREIIEEWMDRYVPARSGDAGPRWLDVGCGTGVLLECYGRIADKVGLELETACVKRAREKGLDVRPAEGWNLAREGTFDVITFCDVLEHLSDERPALAAAAEALKENGTLLVTVPAMSSLWSGHDVVNHHYRRYSRTMLLERFSPEQWQVERVTYFSSLLLPLIYVARKWKNIGERMGWRKAAHDFEFGRPWVDRVLLGIFRLEKKLLRKGSIGLGTSLILVARKKPAAA